MPYLIVTGEWIALTEKSNIWHCLSLPSSSLGTPYVSTGGPQAASLLVCLKYKEMYGRILVLYRKLISRNGLLLITYSNSQRKTHKIAQIRHVEPQKRQHTTIEVGVPSYNV